MPARDFFDTNVLIYAVAKNDVRTSKAEELLAGGGILSVQSLNEFVAVARRKLNMSWKETSEFLDVISILCPNPVAISFKIHRTALAVAEEYQYSIYDSLIIAAALESGCQTLYSEDMQSGQVVNRQLTITNPFL